MCRSCAALPPPWALHREPASLSGMRPPRFFAALAALLLLATIVVTGAHAHHGGPASDRGCVTCTLAQAPATCPDAAPALRAPERAHGTVHEPAHFVPDAPLGDVPSSRAPPAA